MDFIKQNKFTLNNSCSCKGIYLIPKPLQEPYIDITFIIGNKCNANCLFCNKSKNNFEKININTFKNFFIECLKYVKIRKITFTGGEPTLPDYFNSIKEIGEWVKSLNINTKIILNTNGTNLKILVNQYWIDNINIFRHHYNDNINDKIFNEFTASLDDILLFNEINKIKFTCIIQKEGINSGKELETYLHFCQIIGINDITFYPLLKNNQYSIDNYVNPFNFNFSKKIIKFRDFNNPCKNICKCINYIYINKYISNKNIFFYIKQQYNFNKNSYIIWKNNKIFKPFN